MVSDYTSFTKYFCFPMYLSYLRKANALRDAAPKPLQSGYFQEKETRPRVFCMTEELCCGLSASFPAPEMFHFFLNNLTAAAGAVMPPSRPARSAHTNAALWHLSATRRRKVTDLNSISERWTQTSSLRLFVGKERPHCCRK